MQIGHMATLTATRRQTLGLWSIAGVVLVIAVLGHVIFSSAFEYGRPARNMPIMTFATGLLTASVLALFLHPMVRHTPQSLQRTILVLVFAVGLGARLFLLGGTPVLEVDFNRYLWDGSMTFHGYNPYSLAPADMIRLPYDDPRLDMSKAAGEVFDGISYPQYKTIYPPIAQIYFSLSHAVSAWSLTAWRTIAIGQEMITFGLLILLLQSVGRAPLWAAVYWWHPLVLKETIDSAHMEVVLTPFVLGALLASVRQRHAVAIGLLTLAIGTKVWPILLAPLIFRPLVSRPAFALTAGTALAAACVAFALPVVQADLGPTSGFVGFATSWATNSAHFAAVDLALRTVFGIVDPADLRIDRVLRLTMAAIAVLAALVLAVRPLRGSQDLLNRAYWTVTVLLLVSPTQFPWYLLWVLPLAVVQSDARAWFVAAALLPLYYTAFHFNVRNLGAWHASGVVWLIWLPVWWAMAQDVQKALNSAPNTLSRPGQC
jgi:alpha-1,6-mannosyltransferase